MSETFAANDGNVGLTYRESTPWWPEPNQPPSGSPDIVMVLLDDVGFGSLGCYGAEIETPAIDSLAADGLRYTNFHVTPLCSPTRACLLTGRNHHSVGMSLLSNADSGFPGKRGAVSNRAAMVSQALRDAGYNTAAFGKWHLTPMDQTTAAGPYDQWPVARGFERYYGFLEGLTDHYYPELVRDNQRVEPPRTPEDGYHLTEDLIDNAIEFISDQKSIAPEKPYFLYLPLGTAHTPHQAPAHYLNRCRGRYDEGWDVIRERRLARQRELGVVPEDTELAPRNEGVPAWNELSADEQRVMARMQEAFAAMLEHTDDQLARLFDHLQRLGTRENTLVLLLTDNGASQEGGASGTCNTIAYENGDEVSLADNLAHLDEIGGPRCHSNYPWGWAQAGNTPLKRYKQNTHAGGVRAPLIVSWPNELAAHAGGFRDQFHHAIDVTPTLLDIAGISAPDSYQGTPQLPMHGQSMRYSFAAPAAPSTRRTQYFEMYGHRAIWHNGWKAVAFHERGTDYDEDHWELYHLPTDFAEKHDLAKEHPGHLHELIGRWWAEAERYDVFPLDDRNFAERAAKYHSAASPRRRREFTLYPGMTRLPGGVTPAIYDRAYRIDAQIEMSSHAEGVLVAQGDVNGGYVLFVQSGQLHYEYNHQGTRYHVTGPCTVDNGTHQLSMDFQRSGTLHGTAHLLIDDAVVASGEIRSTARYLVGWQGLTIAHDALSPVSDSYPPGFAFTGRLNWVRFHLDNGPDTLHEPLD